MFIMVYEVMFLDFFFNCIEFKIIIYNQYIYIFAQQQRIFKNLVLWLGVLPDLTRKNKHLDHIN